MADQVTNTTNSNTLPEWAAPAINQVVSGSMGLAELPYQPYGGQRLEDFTPLQQQAFNSAANMQTPGQNAQGTNLANQAGIAGLNTGRWTDPGVAQSYMSPYALNVANVQNDELARNAEIMRNQNQSRAAQAGAYGGYRHGLVDSEMYRNTQQQMNNNTQTALQQAYQSGMGQYNQDRTAGLQGLGVANQSASTLGGLGQQQLNSQVGIASLQNQFGGQQQALGQQGRDIDYQNFQQQVNWPYQQMNFLNGIMRGYNTSQNNQTQTLNTEDPSRWSQIFGAGLGAYSLGKTFNWW